MAPSTVTSPRGEGLALWQKLASASLLAAYFLWFAWDGLHARWASDDMMNIYLPWKPGPWHLLYSQFALWHGEYRPMGGAFYVPMFHFFGFNPLPYRIAILLLLGLNVWVAYRFARALGCGELAATLAAAVVAYHGGLGSLHYNTDTIYDILCFTFYFGAFLYYAGIRSRGRLPGAGQTAVFLALFVCALNSKEMAVTLPVALLAYEMFFHLPDGWKPSALRAWVLGPGRTALWAGAVTLLSLYGKKYGPNGLLHSPNYQPVFTLERIVNFQRMWIRELFFWNDIGVIGMVAFWAAVTALAWALRRPALRFCWVFVVVAPLPIEFLEGRDQACLYIPLAAWAVFAAIIVSEEAARLSRNRALMAAFLAVPLLFWVRENRYLQKTYVHKAMVQQGLLTQEVIRQFDALQPRVPPHSEVVFLSDPFDGYDMEFIANLWLRDRTTNVHLQRIQRLPESEVAKMIRFTWENGKLVKL
ncbi:MAG: hypothetical protein LAQ30_13715 [Acidobacteriia bacterium]|nr:hypothetical protein [Terriglobia bacterium]